MKIQWRWFVLAAVVIGGVVTTHTTSQSMRDAASGAWRAEATQAARRLLLLLDNDGNGDTNFSSFKP